MPKSKAADSSSFKYEDMLLCILFIFRPFGLNFCFGGDRKLTFETIETQVNPVGFQNKTAFCERDASDSLPVDQNHSTIKMKTDPVYFGC